MKNKGISLIVLVITIVVVIILAAAVILSLGDRNPINDARVANIAQTRDSMESAILTHISSVSSKEAGKYDTKEIILGVANNGDDISEYSLVVSSNPFEHPEAGIVYELDLTKLQSKANLKVTTPTNDSKWYVDKYGKVYLMFDEEATIPTWLKGDSEDNDEISNPTLKSFVVKAPEGSSVPEADKSIFKYGNFNGKWAVTGIEVGKTVPENLKFPSKDPDGKTIEAIQPGLFYNNNTIKNVIIPDSYTSIGDAVFNTCTSIETIKIGNNVTSIGNGVFQGCINLKTVKMGNNVQTMASAVFQNCSSLESINLSTKLTSVGSSCFTGCTSLKSLVLPDSMTSLSNDPAFQGLTALESLTLSKGLTSIPNSAFAGCSKLKELVIPGNIKTVGNSAFSGAGSLTKITIEEGVETIYGQAFAGANVTEIVLPKSLKGSTCNGAFTGVSGIKKVTLPNSVTSVYSGPINIFTSSFSNSIEEVCFADDVTEIGTGAFNTGYEAGSSIKKMNLPNTLTKIGSNAFWGCKLWEDDVVIPASVTTIESSAFRQCQKIKSVTFASGSQLKTIGENAFSYCRFTEITVPSGVETIEQYAFSDNPNLTTLNYDGDATGHPWGANNLTSNE